MIDSYRFGEMVIEGKRYRADLIIYPDRVDASWWRRTGHEVCIADIAEIVAEKPEYLIFGTGNPGYMKVLPETEQYLRTHGIQFVAEPTERAYQLYNAACSAKRVIAAFHLTC